MNEQRISPYKSRVMKYIHAMLVILFLQACVPSSLVDLKGGDWEVHQDTWMVYEDLQTVFKRYLEISQSTKGNVFAHWDITAVLYDNDGTITGKIGSVIHHHLELKAEGLTTHVKAWKWDMGYGIPCKEDVLNLVCYKEAFDSTQIISEGMIGREAGR